jgi:hypothetical protein
MILYLVARQPALSHCCPHLRRGYLE